MRWFEAALSCCLVAVASAGKLFPKTNVGCPLNHSLCDSQHIVSTVLSTNSSLNYVYLWSDVGVPAIAVARSPKASSHKLNIDWNVDAETPEDEPVFSVDLPVEYVQTTLFTRMFAINTTTYTLQQAAYRECILANRSWTLGKKTLNANGPPGVSDVKANFTMVPANVTTAECEFSVLFATSDTEGREKLLPHLKYSENSTRLELEFHNFSFIDIDNSTGEVRDLAKIVGMNFVLEVLIIPDTTHPDLQLASGKSLDDEYTPSQFWHSDIVNGANKGFHYWKPIVYTNATSRTIKNSAHIDLFKIHNKQKLVTLSEAGITEVPYSLATVLNGGNISLDDVRVLYLTFNSTQTNVTVFDMVIGFGEVPSDSVSLTVILIIALGLGLPSLVLFFGVPTATVYRRCSKKKGTGGYAPIQ
ncbi:glycosylated lysosomal membrane protein-like [Sycon ciliatum]|uniref:glycosylated lysosomal membrane protein-like n=1 Tax=Sycon ciliatum TaxID=27933 RepID=UPI0031F71EE9